MNTTEFAHAGSTAAPNRERDRMTITRTGFLRLAGAATLALGLGAVVVFALAPHNVYTSDVSIITKTISDELANL